MPFETNFDLCLVLPLSRFQINQLTKSKGAIKFNEISTSAMAVTSVAM